MKMILTGGAGFIGSCFLWQLNAMGVEDVIVVDTLKEPSPYPSLKKKKFKAYVSREELLERLSKGQLKEIDLVIHLGACSDTTEMDRAFLTRNNLEYSKTLAKWALGLGKRFHYASSAAVYGDGKQGYSDNDSTVHGYKPLNPYGESKLAFDQWVIDEKLSNKVVGYRYFNVFGPNEYHKGEMRSMVCKAFQQVQALGEIKLFASSRSGKEDGSEERDFIYVKDINQVMAYFVEHPDRAGIFNLGTGQARSFKDLGMAVFSAMGKPVRFNFIPMPEKLRGQYQYFTQANIDKLRAAGYKQLFTSLEDSISDYIKNHLSKEDPYL
jgi:ADP-L-glycero-D-manno-heptose 6-epimerase